MIEDSKLSEHFGFYEYTATSKEGMQEINREEGLKVLPTLQANAQMMERIRGDRPIIINSAFRSYALNGVTKGSSITSQHPRGQATDFHRPNESVDVTFQEVLERLIAERIPFGQLIDETADRGYAVSRWLHLSLGQDFWMPERCGEVLKMVAGPDGKPKYTMIMKFKMP